MKKGGYQIIDFKGKSFTVGTGMVCDGVYELIESTTKTILVSGLVIANLDYHDAYVNFKVNASNFEGDLYGYTIEVQNNDVVTIKNA